MDLHNKPTSQSRHQGKPAPALKNLNDLCCDVMEFNYSFAATLLQKKVHDRFSTEQPEDFLPMEKELFVAQLTSEKSAAFDTLIAQHSPFLDSLGLTLSLRSTSVSTTDFNHDEALFQLDKGKTFVNYLSTLAGKHLTDQDNVTLYSIMEDLLSYLQFESDFTDSSDTPSIECAVALGGIVENLKKISGFQEEATILVFGRYLSLLEHKCLHGVITLERAGIFAIGTLRLNESGGEFIHIPYSHPSLRWHIVCSDAESYRNVWELAIGAIEKLLPFSTYKQLTTLAITTTLDNLNWIKHDLNSNGWNLRDDDQTEEFKIVVDEVAERLTEMLGD